MTQRQIPKGDKPKIAKLAAAAQALREGYETCYSVTKLISLKSLCKEPETANHFVFYLAQRTQAKMETTPRPNLISEANCTLYQTLIAEVVTAMGNYLEDPTAGNLIPLRKLRNRARNVQNEYRQIGWNTVRTIYSTEVLLIEYALECMISPQLAPEYAYYTGREYAERYEPRYGTGLVLASVPMLEDIVQFWHQYYDL